jgi:hypothetical protein
MKGKTISDHPEKGREVILLSSWILGILLLGFGIAFFGEGTRNYFLLRSVNSYFEEQNEGLRLEKPLPKNDSTRPRLISGDFFSIGGSKDTALIDSMLVEGTSIVYAMILSPQGTITRMIPLGSHSAAMQERVAGQLIALFKQRIEAEIVERK